MFFSVHQSQFTTLMKSMCSHCASHDCNAADDVQIVTLCMCAGLVVSDSLQPHRL